MTDLGPLFGRKGEWLGYDADTLAALPPERQQLYADVEAAARELETAEADLKTAQADVTECVARVRDAEAAMPKRDFHSLWREHFARPRHGKSA
jgi:hypothetical protein